LLQFLSKCIGTFVGFRQFLCQNSQHQSKNTTRKE
jgi:hypothetical protein